MLNLNIKSVKCLVFRQIKYLVLSLLILLSINLLVFAQIEIDDDEITIDSSIVLLNATITDKNGKASSSLNKTQFQIFENGIEQKISYFSKQETPFAAVVLIDTSGSMERRVSMARAATIKFLDGIRAYDSVAIFNFDSKITLVQDFSSLRDLLPKVYDLKASGWTVLNDAIFNATDRLRKREEKRKAIVVLSDGADTRSGRSSKKALKYALENNITIYTVDMSSVNSGGNRRLQNKRVLKNFAKKSGGKFIETPGGREMRAAFETIVKDLGIQYTIGYSSTNQKRDGKWRKIDLQVTDKNLLVRTREGYNASKH